MRQDVRPTGAMDDALVDHGTRLKGACALIAENAVQCDGGDAYTVRSDANLTDKHRVWGRYFWQKSPNVNAGVGVDVLDELGHLVVLRLDDSVGYHRHNRSRR